MSNNKDKQSITVQHMHIFKMVEQKNESEICKNKFTKFSFILLVAGPRQSIFTYVPML